MVTIFSTLDASVLYVRVSSENSKLEIILPVKEGCAARRDFFLTQVLIEEHGGIRDGPWEVDVLSESFRSGNAVLQGTFVEHVRWEFRQARMHTILDLKSDGPVA